MWNAIKTVAIECYDNRYRLFRLASYELKAQNNGTVLGFFWNLLNPALQILIYWLVFKIGLNAAAPQGGYPYIIWMIFGIIPWFYISSSLIGSTGAIYNFSGVLKRMNFPPAVVPVKTVFSAFFGHLFAMCVVFSIYFLCGYKLGINALWLFYFMLCSLVFLVGYALFASAITVVFRDFQKFMNSVIRLLFYLSPVVWNQESLPDNLRFVLRLNPLAYIIDGYRESVLYNHNLLFHWKQGIYFWVFTLALFAFGCTVHMRLRRQFMDLI